MEVYAGIDLHSSNSFIGIVDKDGQRLFGQRFPNSTNSILMALDRYKKNIKGVVIESTYNWYWLVDALKKEGYPVHLANPAGNKQYEGIKFSNDETDSYWLADLLRLGILKEGYIYPKEERATRDMLRRRMFFVHQRTANILSLQSMITRNLGIRYSGVSIKRLEEKDLQELFGASDLFTTAYSNIMMIELLSKLIKEIEDKIR